jgi:hypothetical protein
MKTRSLTFYSIRRTGYFKNLDMNLKGTNKIIQVLINYSITICILFFGYFNQSICQEKINVVFGIGFPELINVGMLCQHNQAQYGINIGGWYYTNNFLGNFLVTSISGDFYYHFAGFSELSKRRPWYIRSGLTYFNASPEDKHLFLNCRLGRDFNYFNKFGLTISIGLITRLYYNYKNDIEQYDDNHLFLYPSAGLSYFYRIGNNFK